eukprot:Gb_34794 [translate_table: standard]
MYKWRNLDDVLKNYSEKANSSRACGFEAWRNHLKICNLERLCEEVEDFGSKERRRESALSHSWISSLYLYDAHGGVDAWMFMEIIWGRGPQLKGKWVSASEEGRRDIPRQVCTMALRML